MSLLDRKLREDVIVYHEITVVDDDGNKKTTASDVGVPEKADIQVVSMSGTSARRAEQDNEGFESEQQYRIRFRRSMPPLGAQAEIEWNGQRWGIFGDVRRFNGSRATKHDDYQIKRS